MHDQLERLYLAAKTLRGVSGQSAVARAQRLPANGQELGEQGVSTPGLIAAGSAFRVFAGMGKVWDGSMTSSQDVRTAAQSDNERERFHGVLPLKISRDLSRLLVSDWPRSHEEPPFGRFFFAQQKINMVFDLQIKRRV